MEQLETIKGKSIVIPKIAKRYIIVYYSYFGWRVFDGYNNFSVNPETALEQFFEWAGKIKEENVKPKYYKVIELDLEIPFVPQSSE